jgi:hypothetical protein
LSCRKRRAGVVVLGLAIGCQAGLKDPAGPVLPPDPPGFPPFTRTVFVFDVNVPQGTVVVQAPALEGSRLAGGQGDSPARSIVGSDVIGLAVSNYYASPPGAVQPNRIRVQFEVQVLNKLVGYDLVTPTFPEPPAGAAGLLLIPYSTVITTTTGGVGVPGDGTVIVGTPANGLVLPSVDWNGHATPDRPTFPAAPGAGGLPHNFFNDASCSGFPDPEAAGDCFRYETYGVLSAGALSPPRRIGFDLEASVGQFRTMLLAVADLRPSPAPSTGAVTGTISSPQRGPLQGVRVDIQGVGAYGLTDGGGGYLITGVGGGARTVTVSALPAGCDPASLSPANGTTVTAPAGGSATLDFTVACTAVYGAVTGGVVRAGPGTQSLTAIEIIVQPAAAGVPAVTAPVLGAAESVSFSAVVQVGQGTGAGEGTVALANLPAGCLPPPAAAYSGLVPGGSVEVGFTVQCDPMPLGAVRSAPSRP